MALSSLLPYLLLLLLLKSSNTMLTATAAGGEDEYGLTHIHLYLHGMSTGVNATIADVLQSPLGANSSFGYMGVLDEEIRVGPDRSSQLVGRYQGVIIGTSLELGKGYLTSISVVFTAGEYNGSTLSVEGPLLGFTGTIERAIVGGTGKFRLARGYMLFEVLNQPASETTLSDINLFVLMNPAGKY